MIPALEEEDETPIIRISSDLPAMVQAAMMALMRDPNLYVRTGNLVTVVREPERPEPITDNEYDSPHNELRAAPGTPTLVTLGWPTLLERLATVARWEKWDGRRAVGDQWVRCHPDRTVVSVVLAKPEKDMLRPLEGVFDAPFLRAGGVVVQTPGYDRASACVYLPSTPFPQVPDFPSHADAVTALQELRDAWKRETPEQPGFPFYRDADRDVPIAALLTLLARPAIHGPVPAFLFDASTRGSGKSLIANVVSLIAAGHAAPVATWASSEEETEKVLGSVALAGLSMVLFDNVAHPIQGAPLDKVLTAVDRVRLRVLGVSEIPSHVWRTVILFTGNNLEVRGDTERRALTCRLEPTQERPEDRSGFAHARLLNWARQERPRLLTAALTLLRAYHVAGRPSQGLQWGTFEAWTDLVPSALKWAGGENVLATRPSVRGSTDSHGAAHLTILRDWPLLSPTARTDGLTIREVQRLLYPDRMSGPPDEKWDDLRDALETLAPHKSGRGFDPNRLAIKFKALRKRWREGVCLIQAEDKGGGGRVKWRVSRPEEDPAEAWNTPSIDTDEIPPSAVSTRNRN